MLKTIKSSEELASRMFKADENEVVGSDGDKADETVINLSKNKKSRKSTRVQNIEAIVEPNFLTPDAKKAFNHLWLAYIKVPIL